MTLSGYLLASGPLTPDPGFLCWDMGSEKSVCVPQVKEPDINDPVVLEYGIVSRGMRFVESPFNEVDLIKNAEIMKQVSTLRCAKLSTDGRYILLIKRYKLERPDPEWGLASSEFHEIYIHDLKTNNLYQVKLDPSQKYNIGFISQSDNNNIFVITLTQMNSGKEFICLLDVSTGAFELHVNPGYVFFRSYFIHWHGEPHLFFHDYNRRNLFLLKINNFQIYPMPFFNPKDPKSAFYPYFNKNLQYGISIELDQEKDTMMIYLVDGITFERKPICNIPDAHPKSSFRLGQFNELIWDPSYRYAVISLAYFKTGKRDQLWLIDTEKVTAHKIIEDLGSAHLFSSFLSWGAV